nr:hypothetical protein [Corynebacterium lactis]
MSYADSVIDRYEATVDDEYQRMLLHQSSTVAFTALMWLSYILAVALIWALPGPNMEIAAMVMFVLPLLGLIVGQWWLRRRVPLPRVNKISIGEIIALVLILALFIGGMARSRMMVGSELAGYLTGSVVGVGMGLALVLVIFKIIYPMIRQRDQRRLDRELGED